MSISIKIQPSLAVFKYCRINYENNKKTETENEKHFPNGNLHMHVAKNCIIISYLNALKSAHNEM